MTKLADASINNLRISEADVSPEDPIFVLTSSQLRQIITQAVQDAIQPLQDEVVELKATVASQQAEMASMKADIKLDGHDIRDLYDALASLEQSHIQPLQRDRGEILRALITANGGKMLAKEARQKMHLRKELFSMLLSSMTEEIEIKPLHSDKRKKVLMLK